MLMEARKQQEALKEHLSPTSTVNKKLMVSSKGKTKESTKQYQKLQKMELDAILFSHFQQIVDLYEAIHGKGDGGKTLVDDKDPMWQKLREFDE